MGPKKAKTMIQEAKKVRSLRPDDIWYILEVAERHPKWSVKRIFEDALAPRLRTSLCLPLTPKMKKQFDKAAKKFDMSVPFVAYHAIEEWMEGHGL